MLVGLIGIILKLTEPFIITKGCFGYDYIYEFISFGIPIIILVIGYRIYKRRYHNQIDERRS